jgi:hypothetical protein
VTRRRALIASLLVVGGVSAHAGRAEADAEEIGRRVKAVGVDEALSARIQAAVEAGCRWLRGRQSVGGAFDPRSAGWAAGDASWTAGATALAGLALRHAGKAAALEGGRSSMDWLAGEGRRDVLASTYAAGFAAMLLRGPARTPGRERDLLEEVADSLADSFRSGAGAWDYGPTGDYASSSKPNLSTSQVGALGLWAAARAGVEVAPRIWKGHLEALLASQHLDGSWPYTGRTTAGLLSNYPTGAYMGVADVVLAKDALREALSEEPRRSERVDVAIARGMWATRRFARWTFARVGMVSGFPHYELFALEKACVFTGTHHLGPVAWYRAGALALLDAQRADGSWTSEGEGETVATALALLFLLRAIETYTPRDPADPAPASAPTVSLATARERLAQLEERLDLPTVPGDDLVSALGGLEVSLRGLDPAAPPSERAALLRDATTALLRALRLARTEGGVNLRGPVNARAAEVLAVVTPAPTEAMIGFLEDVALPQRGSDVGVEVWSACFDLLAASGDGVALRWISAQGLPAKPDRATAPRAAAALVAMQRAGGAPREDRRAAARAIVATLRALPAGSPLLPDAVLALRDLLREGDVEALGDDGKPLASLEAASKWMAREER